MKKIFFSLLTIILTMILFTSCCKDPGEGGDASLVVQLRHHDKLIESTSDSIAGYPQGFKITIYIKYDAEESPGTSPESYDRVIEAGEHGDHIHVDGLKCGKYFIYAKGFDKDINSFVSGGIGIKIKHKNRKKETEIDIPVTE